MPFPKNKVRFRTPIGTSPRYTAITDDESGIVSIKYVDCNTPLPDAENFDVANLVKAGITLKEVNTSVIPSSPSDFESFVSDSVEKVKSKINSQPSNKKDE